jgi:hypothetical protein
LISTASTYKVTDFPAPVTPLSISWSGTCVPALTTRRGNRKMRDRQRTRNRNETHLVMSLNHPPQHAHLLAHDDALQLVFVETGRKTADLWDIDDAQMLAFFMRCHDDVIELGEELVQGCKRGTQ